MTRVLIVAHGQPSDPPAAAQALDRLAVQVAALLPGWQIEAATLAEPGKLEEAAAGRQGLIFPLFMAGGWFARTEIPARLRAAEAGGWRMLEPFGCLAAVHELTVRIAAESGTGRVLLAAHGSFKSPVPAAIARHVAGRISREAGVPTATAFIDQTPQLQDATGYGPDTVCLPFFAMAGGHVCEDIPVALASAGFAGRILPPVGLDARVPALIASALLAGTNICAGACRFGP